MFLDTVMYQIEFITDSFLRRQAKPLNSQPGADVRTIGKGLILRVKQARMVSRNLMQIQLDHPFNGHHTWLVSRADVKVYADEARENSST
jgi:hypothetical protein